MEALEWLEMEYPKCDGNESLSDASAIPKGDYASVEVFTGDDLHYQTMNPKVIQAIRVVKGYCAMGRGAKKAEDGRQALEHTRAVRMTAQNIGEEGIKMFGQYCVQMIFTRQTWWISISMRWDSGP
jgi:hypothetical protein